MVIAHSLLRFRPETWCKIPAPGRVIMNRINSFYLACLLAVASVLESGGSPLAAKTARRPFAQHSTQRSEGGIA